MLEFEILGPLLVKGESGDIAIPGARRRALLIRLLVSANHAISADLLIEDVWDGNPPTGPVRPYKVTCPFFAGHWVETGSNTTQPAMSLPARKRNSMYSSSRFSMTSAGKPTSPVTSSWQRKRSISSGQVASGSFVGRQQCIMGAP